MNLMQYKFSASNEVVFVNFYADWCRFSQQLKPIYLEASEKFTTMPPGKVLWASVDSDREVDIAQKYNVNKYPTLKLFRHGELVKREYRAQRSVEALSDFIYKQLNESIITIASTDDLKAKMDKSKRNVVAYFNQLTGSEYDNFRKVSSALREDCVFWVGSGTGFENQFANGNKVLFYPPKIDEIVEYKEKLTNLQYLKDWLGDKCIPLVREITFENAEELTEEGLPFLILFRIVGDMNNEKIFNDAVIRELYDQKNSINCLVADGEKFAHPLHHLGKSKSDLPVIAIDSFRHMYVFDKDVSIPGTLRQFVLDLHSGKLHREFHHGPDIDTTQQSVAEKIDPAQQVDKQKHVQIKKFDNTQPPPSVFNKLKPSENRYSLLHKDEL
ncbi:unnamed protein product [Dracunculus medinensis]|uniref:Thioredoxin domain-containing protein n=1 Tax=Dracunculus medinensis TaxID=318479 RepID=A0A0N4U605_DRAME|nr:unnamed protein product [Dracunculus medinensis]